MLFVDNRSQLRSCHDLRLFVTNPKDCKPTLIHRLSELKELIIYFHTPLHQEHFASVVRYDNKHTLQYVLHEKVRQRLQLTLVAELRLMANEHPKFEDDVPQFSGKLNEKFVELVY